MRIIASAALLALTFVLVIAVHEFGNYAAARMVGVRPRVFALGFGKPPLSRTNRSSCEWRIARDPVRAVDGVELAPRPLPSDMPRLGDGSAPLWRAPRGGAVIEVAGPRPVAPLLGRVEPGSPAADGASLPDWSASSQRCAFPKARLRPGRACFVSRPTGGRAPRCPACGSQSRARGPSTSG